MLKYTSFLICAIFVAYNEGAYVDTLSKCELKDQECLKNLFQSVVQGMGHNGISELNIPSVDPMGLTNVTVTIMGLLDLKLEKGTATGLSACTFEAFAFDLEKGTGYQANSCSIIIEGEYVLSSNNAIIKSIFGKNNVVRGNGHGKAIIDDLFIAFNFPTHAEKRDDGEIYLNIDINNIKYDYEIRGGAKFAADNIYIGEQETSKTIIPFLNENWKFIMTHFGKPFIDKATELYFDMARKFSNAVPAKHYIIDDLTSFAKP